MEERVKLLSVTTIAVIALLMASFAAIINPGRVDAIASNTNNNESAEEVVSDDSDVRVADIVAPADPVNTWCGDSNGSLFTTVTVGAHTVGPIKIVIAGTSPTYLDEITAANTSTVPYRAVVSGDSTGGDDGNGNVSYGLPVRSDLYAPAPDGSRTAADVSQVIICYRTVVSTDDNQDSDDSNDLVSSDTNNLTSNSTDDDAEVLAATDDNTEGNVLGANTLAETGAPAIVYIGLGMAMMAASIEMTRRSKPAQVD